MDNVIRHGTRYCFEPPTKINQEWMIQSNFRVIFIFFIVWT